MIAETLCQKVGEGLYASGHRRCWPAADVQNRGQWLAPAGTELPGPLEGYVGAMQADEFLQLTRVFRRAGSRGSGCLRGLR